MSSDNFWATKFAPLRYAVAWLGYAWMRLVVMLPFGVQRVLGKGLGRLAYALLGKRRAIAARNIDACLRELPAEERARILKLHFESLGLSIVEMAMGWFGPLDEVRGYVDVEGAEHIELSRKRTGQDVALNEVAVEAPACQYQSLLEQIHADDVGARKQAFELSEHDSGPATDLEDV